MRDLKSLCDALEEEVASSGPSTSSWPTPVSAVPPRPAALIDNPPGADDVGYQPDRRVAHRQSGTAAHDQRGGADLIILISSMLGLRGGGYMAHYASAKHAVVGLMNSLANELAPQWIRVNSIHPGNVSRRCSTTSLLPTLRPTCRTRPCTTPRRRSAVPDLPEAADRGARRQPRRALPRLR